MQMIATHHEQRVCPLNNCIAVALNRAMLMFILMLLGWGAQHAAMRRPHSLVVQNGLQNAA
eukprot:scaffold152970_cov17-Tisochrysis_lutea.AAC.1